MNNIEKLELKHLCGYLPYGVKLHATLGGEIFEDELKPSNLIQALREDWYKMKLLPLSALTDPMENGSVPIVELMDISLNTNWAKTEYIYTDQGNDEWWVAFKNQNSCFGYNSKKQGFYSLNQKMCNLYVHNQPQLFEYLYSRHFDIYGLIPSRLAIDKRIINNYE